MPFRVDSLPNIIFCDSPAPLQTVCFLPIMVYSWITQTQQKAISWNVCTKELDFPVHKELYNNHILRIEEE